MEQKTHEETCRELKRVYPGVSSGLSTRSVRRFCASEGIHRTSRLTSDQLNRVVSGCVNTVSYIDVPKIFKYKSLLYITRLDPAMAEG